MPYSEDLLLLQKNNMEKNMINGREVYKNVTTEELISLLKHNPNYELECSSGSTRWVKYDRWHSRMGITDNVYYDWYSMKEFREYYKDKLWHFFIM